MVKKKKKVMRKKINKSFSNSKMWFRKYNEEDNWGFTPISWEGWLALVLLIGINVFAANYFNLNKLIFNNWSKFLAVFLFSIVVFVLIARRKTK